MSLTNLSNSNIDHSDLRIIKQIAHEERRQIGLTQPEFSSRRMTKWKPQLTDAVVILPKAGAKLGRPLPSSHRQISPSPTPGASAVP